ncbi:MAG: hypothetical protein CL607_11645 [Anaerolineaceae bacterium]|nr:hypothetical protein [Anaerolineaceae bacterium]
MRMTKIGFLLVMMSLLLLVPTALAQDTIIVTPETGSIGSAFQLTATDLQPNTSYDLEIIFMTDDAVVFTTSRTTDGDGMLSMNIFSEASDPPGHYQVKLLDANGEAIGSAIFVLTEADGSAPAPQDDATPESQQTEPTRPEPSQPNQAEGSVEVRILPRIAPAGGTHDIFVTGLAPEQLVFVTITQDATGDEVYNNQFTATDTGRLDVEIYSTLDDAPGDYTVAVVDMSENALATIGLTLEGPTGTEGVLTIEPATAEAGDTPLLTLSKVNAFRDFDIRIANAETNEIIFDGTTRANADGIATLDVLIDPGTPDGVYSVTVTEETNNTQVAEGQLIIGDVELAPATLSISPASGSMGTEFTVDIANLQPGAAFTFEIVYDGEVVYSVERNAASDGTYSTALGLSESDPAGDYTVLARQGDTTLAESTLTVVADDSTAQAETSESGVVIDLSPATVEPGESLILTARGLQAGERVTVEVSNGSAVIFSETVNADINGTIARSVHTHADDDEGSYSVNIIRGGEVVGSTELVLGTASTTAEGSDQSDEQQTETDTSDVTVNIDPSGGDLGTDYTITITGLDAEETVTIDLLFDGESAYSTEITADVNGVGLLQITSEDSDPVGQYTAAILRDGEQIASAQFGVGEDLIVDSGDAETVVEAEPFEGTITVTPDRGARNTRHEVVIEGLNANETVTLQVSMGEVPVYTTEKTADADGTTSLALRTSETDAAGVYTVSILRPAGEDLQAVGSADFTVTRDIAPDTADNQPENQAESADSDVSVDISPAVGVIGTSHTVTVSGLEAGETVTLEVLFGDSVEYSTERTADSEGSVTLDLVASPEDPTGIYTVEISRDGSVIASGELEVMVLSATAQTSPSEAGEAVPGSLTMNNPEDRYIFQGEEGDVIYVTLVSDDFDTYLILEDEFGSLLASDDDGAGNTNSAIGPFVLPYSGTYTLVSSSYDYYNYGEIVVGDFTLTISETSLSAIDSGVPTTVTFGEGQGTAFFSIDAEVGDALAITVEGDGAIDTRLQLRDPEGYVVAEDDDSGSGFDPELARYVVQMAGTYVLSVEPFYADDNGTVTVTVEQSSARFLDEGPVSIRLSSKQYSEMLRLSATDGESIVLSVEQANGSLGDVYITVMQDGITLASFYSATLPDNLPLAFVSQGDTPINILFESSFGSGQLDVSISE